MGLVTSRQLLNHDAERGHDVPASNIDNMEQGLAIREAAWSIKRGGKEHGDG